MNAHIAIIKESFIWLSDTKCFAVAGRSACCIQSITWVGHEVMRKVLPFAVSSLLTYIVHQRKPLCAAVLLSFFFAVDVFLISSTLSLSLQTLNLRSMMGRIQCIRLKPPLLRLPAPSFIVTFTCAESKHLRNAAPTNKRLDSRASRDFLFLALSPKPTRSYQLR